MQRKNITIHLGYGVGDTVKQFEGVILEFKSQLGVIPKVTIFEGTSDTAIEKADIFITELSLLTPIYLGLLLERHDVPVVLLTQKNREAPRSIRDLCKKHRQLSVVPYEKNLSERIPGIINLVEYVRMYKQLKNP